MTYSIFVPLNVPSSKNDTFVFNNRLISGNLTSNYRKKVSHILFENKEAWHEALTNMTKPYRIHFKYYRSSRRRFDYVNPQQTIQDLMTACTCGIKKKLPKAHPDKRKPCGCQWLEDDNADILLPIFEPYEYRKDNPGVEIKLIYQGDESIHHGLEIPAES